MKEDILKLLFEYSSYIQPEEGGSYKAIDENDFEELAEELVKRFRAKKLKNKHL